MMRYLSLGQVMELHRRLIEASGGAAGIRDLGALESALASATKKVMDEYKTICEKILSQSEDLQQMGIKPLTE